jgi:L-arabinose isomerase
VLSTAAEIDRLADFAILLGMELLIIDDSTYRRDFADRICWNRATTAWPKASEELAADPRPARVR